MLHAPALQCEIRRAVPPLIEPPLTDPAALVAEFLELPDNQLEYATAKIAFDAFIDPELDQSWVTAELDRLTASAWQLTRGDRRASVRLGAVRSVLYEPGQWNEHKPFE